MNYRVKVIWFGLVIAFAGACSLVDDKPDNCNAETAIPVDFAFSFQDGSSSTKAEEGFTELSGLTDPKKVFRGVEHLRLIPYSLGSNPQVLYSSQSLGMPRQLPSITKEFTNEAFNGSEFHNGLVLGNRSHFFSSRFISLPTGTSGVLMYGNAPALSTIGSELLKKMRNGSLIERGLDTRDKEYASQIQFDPDPIYGDEAEEYAQSIESVLSDLAKASYLQHYYYKTTTWHEGDIAVKWSDDALGDDFLSDLFTAFSGRGIVIPGAAALLQERLSDLYQSLKAYKSTSSVKVLIDDVEVKTGTGENDPVLTYAHLYNGLKNELLGIFDSKINAGILSVGEGNTVRFIPDKLKTFPDDFMLPAGSTVFRWDGFEMVFEVSGLDGVLPLDHICFMPSLYYYANTTLRASYDPYIYEYYTSNYTWQDILARYNFGNVVMSGVRAVALDNPLQYACGLLVARLGSEQSSISDGTESFDIFGDNDLFPLRGIIVGGQFTQKFDFSPVTDNMDITSPEEFFMYDNRIDGVSLITTSPETGPEFRTLVLPSPRDRDLYFFLEFVNNSEKSFTGIDGVVKPGNVFYLAGRIPKPDDTQVNDGKDRIFMRDYCTTINMVVNSLKNAYLIIPQMGTPDLSLGVKTQVHWVFSGTSYVVLD